MNCGVGESSDCSLVPVLHACICDCRLLRRYSQLLHESHWAATGFKPVAQARVNLLCVWPVPATGLVDCPFMQGVNVKRLCPSTLEHVSRRAVPFGAVARMHVSYRALGVAALPLVHGPGPTVGLYRTCTATCECVVCACMHTRQTSPCAAVAELTAHGELMGLACIESLFRALGDPGKAVLI